MKLIPKDDGRRVEGLTPTHFLLLRPHRASLRPPSRILLLHGWLQSSDVWLTTAAKLRDLYHSEVLMLDWWCHGRSSHNPVELFRVDQLEEQLCAILREVGWDQGALLTVTGISLGGAISLRYVHRHPDRVSRLNLICSAGLDEKWWAAPTMTAPLRRSLLMFEKHVLRPIGLADAPLLRQIFAQLRLISTTPTYGVPPDMPEWLAERKIPLGLIWGRLDTVHSAQVDRWACGRRDSDEVHTLVYPWSGHMDLCSSIDSLELWKNPVLWEQAPLCRL